jgi:peptide/nickel transport system permease protein
MTKDPYGIVAVTMVFGIVFALVNILLDVGVAWLDPRVRLQAPE